MSILTGLFNCPWYLVKHFISGVGLVYCDTNCAWHDGTSPIRVLKINLGPIYIILSKLNLRKKVISSLIDKYLTIIPRVRVGYELVIIISYPTSASGIIVLLKRPQNIENSSRLYS